MTGKYRFIVIYIELEFFKNIWYDFFDGYNTN